MVKLIIHQSVYTPTRASNAIACVAEPPKQKRKKTLELFDDKDDGDSLFGNEDKNSVAKPTTDPKKVEVKNPSEKTGGLFAGSENEKIECKTYCFNLCYKLNIMMMMIGDDDR